MLKIKVIAFVGKAESGKTTAAKYLVDDYGYQRLSFSDGLKRMLYRGLEIDTDYLYGNKKNEPCKELCGRTARHAMITLGTEWGRDMIHPDIWVKSLERQLFKYHNGEDKFVIDDVRFLNEAKWVKDLDERYVTKLIRLDRYSDNKIQHQSETELDNIVPDLIIQNNGTIESLYKSITEVVDDM